MSTGVSKGYMYLGALLLSALGALLVLLRQTTYGVGLVVDSLTHTSTAESLLRGDGFVTAWNSMPQQGQPPLYALLLALTAVADLGAKVSITEYARYVGTIAFALTILTSIVWLSAKIRSRKLVIVAGGICALSPFLGELFSYALTETLFILLVALSLLALDRFLDSHRESMLIIAAIFAALGWLTRHIGVTVVVSSLLILLARKGPTSRQKFHSVMIYSIISILPPSLWMLRNYALLGRFTERRWATDFVWDVHINLASSELIKWVIGTTGLNYLNKLSNLFGVNAALIRVSFLSVLIVLLGAGFVYLHRRNTRIQFAGLIVPVVFVSVYCVALFASLVLTDVALEPRYFAPIYIPILVATVIILDHCITYTSKSRYPIRESPSTRHFIDKRTLRFAVMAILSLHLALVVFSSYDQIKKWREQGYSYSAKAWVSSETISHLNSNPLKGWIYSNNARAVYIHMDATDDVEVRYSQLQAELPSDAPYWSDKARAENLDMHVVWFHGWKPFIQTQYDVTQLLFLLDLEIVAILEDGVVLKANNDTEIASLPGYRGNDSTFEAVLLQGSELIVRSTFDIYSKGSRLIYISTRCHDAELENPFFLHVFPTDSADIAKDRKTSSFNNYDFRFDREGFSFRERCAVIRNLPDYDIELIRTGQFTSDGTVLWEESVQPRVS